MISKIKTKHDCLFRKIPVNMWVNKFHLFARFCFIMTHHHFYCIALHTHIVARVNNRFQFGQGFLYFLVSDLIQIIIISILLRWSLQ